VTDEGREAGATEEGAEGEDEEPRPRPSRRVLGLVLGSLAALTVVGFVASALTPTLAARHPQLLILLEARNRNLVLARDVEIVPFVVIAAFRRTLSDPLYYLLGLWYGDRAVRWLEVKAGMGSYARVMERIFRKAGAAAVFLFPGAIVCALAGVVRMRFRLFLALNLAGTLAAVLVLRAFGDVVASPVEALIDFFDRNLLETTLASIGLVVLSVVLGRWDAKSRERLSLEEAEAELEGRAPLPEGDPTDP